MYWCVLVRVRVCVCVRVRGTGLIAARESRLHGEATALAASAECTPAYVDANEYVPVHVDGTFEHDLEFEVWWWWWW